MDYIPRRTNAYGNFSAVNIHAPYTPNIALNRSHSYNAFNNISNSHGAACQQPCASLQRQARDTYDLEQQLLTEREFLRQSIRNVRKSTVAECSKILDSIINYCECKASCGGGPCQMRKSRASSCVNLERVGAGCSTGGCGGYTPSGWNKLQIIHCLQCEDPDCPCCCCPPCSCSEQCPGPCPCCPCPCCPCPCQETKRAPPSRKYKTYNLSCNSKPADENFSAVQARPSAKILGELAFQLERRILDYVFGMEGSKRRRFYGYTVNNIYDMMEKESKNYKGDDDPSRKTELMSRLKRLLCGLKKVGYNIKVHGDFAQLVINRYGLLSCPPDSDTIKEFGLQDVKCISSLITQLARGQHEANNLQILLKGLKYLSKCDGGPLFIW